MQLARFSSPRFAAARDAMACAGYFQVQTGERFGALEKDGGWYIFVVPAPNLNMDALAAAIVDYAQGMEAAYKGVLQDQAVAMARRMN